MFRQISVVSALLFERSLMDPATLNCMSAEALPCPCRSDTRSRGIDVGVIVDDLPARRRICHTGQSSACEALAPLQGARLLALRAQRLTRQPITRPNKRFTKLDDV